MNHQPDKIETENDQTTAANLANIDTEQMANVEVIEDNATDSANLKFGDVTSDGVKNEDLDNLTIANVSKEDSLPLGRLV